MSDKPVPKSFAISGTQMTAPDLEPGLYLVATPIGNLKDISIRALETLAAADLVLCEDTRHSARLLDHYAIRAKKVALHAHNEDTRSQALVEEIAGGRAVALISDAGTPLLSDPGFPLVRACRQINVPVTAIPGASALLAGLTVSGLTTNQFGFVGFLPPKSGARRAAIEALSARQDTLVFYESPRRLAATLADMADIFGSDRMAAVALELTKRFERVEKGTLGELADLFGQSDTKGEAVILVEGAADAPAASEEDWMSALKAELDEGSLREAVDSVTAQFNLKRKQVYNAALALKNDRSD